MKLHLSEPRVSGYYVQPGPRVQIYGWSICDEDHYPVAHMTADDNDLAERRALAERMVRAFNEAR